MLSKIFFGFTFISFSVDFVELQGTDPRSTMRAEAYGKLSSKTEFFNVLLEHGNVTVPSDGCQQISCNDTPSEWTEFTPCSVPLPGNSGHVPLCYNSLQTRRRSCSNFSNTCHEVNWKICLHNQSCTGQWSAWTEYDGDCYQLCSKTQTRNRTCIKNGKIAPGMCYNSNFMKHIDIETKICHVTDCKNIPIGSIVYIATMAIRVAFLLALCGLVACKTREPPSFPKPTKSEEPSHICADDRHYSFAVDNPPQNEIKECSTEVVQENIYEDATQPPNFEMPSYASAEELRDDNDENDHYTEMSPPQQRHIYERPLKSASQSQNSKWSRNLRVTTNVQRGPVRSLVKSKSVGIISQTTNVSSINYYGQQHHHQSFGTTDYYSALDLGQSNSYGDPPLRAGMSEHSVDEDTEIYTPMKSPTDSVIFEFPN